MSTVIFDSALPLDDAVLSATIGTASTVELRRDDAMLLDVVRIVRAAPLLQGLKITGLSMLKAGETGTVVYGQADALSYKRDPTLQEHNLWDLERLRPAGFALERLDISGKFQPECRMQMEWLIKALLHSSSGLKELKLNLFEYPSDQVVAQLKEEFPMPTTFALPPMLGMEPKPTEEEQELEMQGRWLGNRIAEAILGHVPQCIEAPRSELEVALDELMARAQEMSAAETPVVEDGVSVPEDESPVAKIEPPVPTETRLTQPPTVAALFARRPLLRNMTHAQYDGLMQTLYTTPLPEAMESLSMRVILRGGQVQSRFLFLPQLTTLDLQFCEMDDEAFAVIGPTIGRRMPSLRTLRLARNRLTDAELGALVGPELALLDCSSNPITSRSAGHLFRAMAFNDRLHEVDLSFTHIDGTLSFVGLNHWTASPALLRIPSCLPDEDVIQASLYVHEGVELELVCEPCFAGLRQREEGMLLLGGPQE
jgi:hypothetical protein